MASPNKSLKDLSGKWKLNKGLSVDVASILALQGTSALIRKAIGSASVTLTISQPTDNEYSIKQTATAAAIPGTTEQYILDNEWRTNHDPFFGEVKGRSSWISIDEASKMLELETTWEDGGEGKLILAEGGHKDGGWQAFRIWGFKDIEGQKRYTQAVHVWNTKGEELKGDMVYDYLES